MPRLLAALCAFLLLVTGWCAAPGAAGASLDDDRYDGNIYALYAGNGSLVPPRSSLEEVLAEHRIAVLVFYLDDSTTSKRFAPVVSEMQRVWGNRIALIPMVTDPLQDRPDLGPGDPARYWKGSIPQVVVIDERGKVVFDASGQVDVDAINASIARLLRVEIPASMRSSATMSFNELNSEVVPSR